MSYTLVCSGCLVHTPSGPRKSGMPADVEMPAPVSTAIFLLIPQGYHAVMSVCTAVLVRHAVVWCVGVGVVGCWLVLLRCFRHAGVWLVFRGFVGCLVVVGLRGCGWWCMLFSCCRSPAGFLRGVGFVGCVVVV